jgi:hypothetical protein
VHSVCCVAFWFTRRADSFRGFVGNPNRHEPWVNKLREEESCDDEIDFIHEHSSCSMEESCDTLMEEAKIKYARELT